MEDAVKLLCDRAEAAVHGGYNIIVLSDRMVGPDRIPIPALLATAAVHHHLIRKGLRTSVGLVIETGEAREVHHFACLAGFGAEAINPYLAFETLIAMKADMEIPEEVDEDEIVKRFIKATGKGLLKVMSKMGISTYQSYCGAQIFDAVGLSSAFVNQYFFGTATTIEGVGLEEIAEETVVRHKEAFSNSLVLKNFLDVGGDITSASAARIISGRRKLWRISSTPCAPMRASATTITPSGSTRWKTATKPFAACSISRRREKRDATRCRSMRWNRRARS